MTRCGRKWRRDRTLWPTGPTNSSLSREPQTNPSTSCAHNCQIKLCPPRLRLSNRYRHLRLFPVKQLALPLFILLPFRKKNIEGISMTPYQGNIILFRSSHQHPRLCIKPFKCFLSWHGALQGPSTCLVHCSKNQGHRQVCRHQAQRSHEPVKNSWHKPWLWKLTFLHRSLMVEKSNE